jgi:hypothetical protein
LGVNEHDIHHGKEGGDTGNRFRTRRRAMLLEFKHAPKQALLSVKARYWFGHYQNSENGNGQSPAIL